MGGSGEDPNKGIDGLAGEVVWVHRRNVSLRPGKILGPDMSPEGSVLAPRSGTDSVKLLDTDDADVDWHILDKSKRPKAIHFGNHDHGIEKLQASDSNSDESQDSDEHLSGSESDWDSSGDISIITESESFGNLYDVPLVSEEKGYAGLPSVFSSQSSHVHTTSLSSEENESRLTDSIEIPEWQTKRKRNLRSRKSYLLLEDRDVGPIETGPRPVHEARSGPFCHSHLKINPFRGLYDVPVEVNSSCMTRRVPYISLVSMLTGYPIVGHSLTIEVLDEDNDISTCPYIPAKGGPHRFLKSRKSDGLLHKKTRRLSSLEGANRRSQGKDILAVEMVKGPSVACVPLNVVFSRMNADLSSLVRPGRRLGVEVV